MGLTFKENERLKKILKKLNKTDQTILKRLTKKSFLKEEIKKRRK